MERAFAQSFLSAAKSATAGKAGNTTRTSGLFDCQQEGAQSGWVSEPDCLKIPSTEILEGMGGSHFKR
eukprot:scaffold253995_cov16-Tisochrysis_lutea.AAC.1